MRIEKLEGNKIRVTLRQEDLDDYHINVKMLRPDSPLLHTFLFKIMERVKRETGFNPYTGQIVVEASPSGDGIELMVTKISEHKPKTIPAKKGVRVKAVRKRTTPNRVYSFLTFSDVCSVLVGMQPAVLDGCRLYQLAEEFYLVRTGKIPAYDIITEFGTLIGQGEVTEAFLTEHGKLVARGEGLQKMAAHLKKTR